MRQPNVSRHRTGTPATTFLSPLQPILVHRNRKPRAGLIPADELIAGFRAEYDRLHAERTRERHPYMQAFRAANRAVSA